jgi:2-aminoethylphosphonate-pyruvate transaminase
MIKTAVILGAGIGSRLAEETQNKPKGFLVLGGLPIVEESILKLIESKIEKIIIGTGYLSEFYEELARKYPPIRCIKNNNFASNGSMATFHCLKDEIKDDFLLLESDLIYEKSGLKILLGDSHKDVILASGVTNSGDEVYIEADKNNYLVSMSKDVKNLNNIHSELVGISKISYETFKKMCDFFEKEFKNHPRIDYEHALTGISKNVDIFVRKIEDFSWCEIDNKNHLKKAKSIIYPLIKNKEILRTN